MDVTYGSVQIQGQEMKKNATQQAPSVKITHKTNLPLALLMHDPDAPAVSWLHWLVTNIPGGNPILSEGTEVMSYAPPSPPSGTHRYIFTLYEQPSSIMVPPPKERGHFNQSALEKNFALRKVAQVQMKVSSPKK